MELFKMEVVGQKTIIFLSVIAFGLNGIALADLTSVFNSENPVYWSAKPQLVDCVGNETERSWPPSDYELFANVGYYKFHAFGSTWLLARQICEEEGAHLVIINSNAEADVLKALFKKNPKVPESLNKDHVWIGAHERGQHGKFFTIFGYFVVFPGDKLEEAGYLNWSKTPQQPNDPTPDDCVSFYSTGVMFDDACNIKYGFVCEVDLSAVAFLKQPSALTFVPSLVCNERVCPQRTCSNCAVQTPDNALLLNVRSG